MKINFRCKKCKIIFDSEVGNISFSDETMRPVFEKKIVCPKCGILEIDQVCLTELGQSQLTDATMDL